jgi:hypothetical protein
MAAKRRNASKRKTRSRVSAALTKYVRKNPRKAKGRAVRLTNFSGTVRKLANGQIKITGRKKK